jgi:glucose-1-phosphate thymidylyltransferase
MKGIILAGGSATRLQPASLAVNKQLMPIYDKPLIYYPLTTLMLAGLREILIITNPENLTQYKKLFENSSKWGVEIIFATQSKPKGIAEALIIGKDFIGDESVCLILGDNFFHGIGLGRNLQNMSFQSGAMISAYHVLHPHAFGVVEFDRQGRVISLEEKPEVPKSSWAVPGIYFYDSSAATRAKSLMPSPRGEIEITDLNLNYLADEKLSVNIFPRGTAWFDMGTPKLMLSASEYVQTIQERQGLLIGSPEEVAWRSGWITSEQLLELSSKFQSEYGKLLTNLITDQRDHEL